MFDLVVPVYNSFHHVRACLQAVFRNSTLPFHLYILNDCSDNYTTEQLEILLEKYDPSLFTLFTNQQNLGYLKTCNKGISAGKNPFIILVNSDTIATPNYLEKIKDTFDSDPTIGIVNPVSTWANWTRIPYPEGYNINEINLEVQKYSDKKIKDIYFASGFFFAVRRKLFDELGLFDLAYNPGYYEEADFCMKALNKGYRIVVDDSLFIFHHGWGSFMEENRNKYMETNKKLFLSRWEADYKKLEESWRQNNPIKYLQEKLEQPELWKSKEDNLETVSELKSPPSVIKYQLENIKNHPAAALKLLVDSLQKEPSSQIIKNEPKITYILPAISLYGGIISVLQIINRLVLLGKNVNLATYGPIDQGIYRLLPFYFRPYLFPNVETMIAEFPISDLVVATHWETVYSALMIRARTGAKLAYFVQDFEADFYERQDLAAQALLTYKLIPDQIVKTSWLKSKLEPFGGRVKIIPLGLNLDIFHDQRKARPLQIISMARPSSERRNYPILKKVYETIYKLHPEIILAVYGVGYDLLDFDCPVKDYGRLDVMHKVANALNESLVLLDPSTFQGFGRPGLEAMACGTATVLTRCGGITDYAKHDYNCYLIDPTNVKEIVERILSLVFNDEKRKQFITRGLKTAEEYSYINEGEKTAAYLESLIK